jgi:BlaI family transcriptional regulator, penicillinase repressor
MENFMGRIFGGLGETEWIVMKCCWKLGKSSAKNVHEESLKYGQRSYQTIKTILDRLSYKDLIEREKFGPIWLYTPIVSEEKMTNNVIDTFYKVVLGNTFTPIFVLLVKDVKYKKELDEITKMVENLKKNK